MTPIKATTLTITYIVIGKTMHIIKQNIERIDVNNPKTSGNLDIFNPLVSY